ncbi:MAG: hypothetical protein NZM04_01575 [Methylacidiphilales bacterium]|nr:hypothetical protein [Candidatus Methylacidiphilales bacterium]
MELAACDRNRMNYLLYIIFLVLFFLVPPLFFLVNYFKLQFALVWVWLLMVMIGWVLINASVYYHYEHLAEQMNMNPTEDLISAYSSDGAKRVTALLFGWVYAALYTLPWLFIYFGIRFFLNKTKERSGLVVFNK